MIREYGYEYDAVLDEKLWENNKGKLIDKELFGAYCLRSGRDALKAIAREYEPSTVFLPALACLSMVFPFELYGHRVKYYKLNPDYSIDLDSLEISEEQSIFLYMDYFGRNAISDAKLEKLRQKEKIVFIEDRTHSFIWDKVSDFKPEYIIASLRKWVAVPDGGLLWGRVSKPFGVDMSFAATRLKAQCMRHEYLQRGDEALKTEYRRIFSTVSDIMDEDEPSAMSAYSYEIAKNTDWNEIRRVRRRNSEALTKVLQSSPYLTLVQDKPGLSDLYVAFITPFRDEVQNRLSAEGIFNTVIWPLSDEQKKACCIAKYTAEKMLAAPCDQRYTVDDMDFIGNEIVRAVANVNR